MIRGRFVYRRGRHIPYLTVDVEFLDAPDLGMTGVDFVVDTGADRTSLSRETAEEIGLNLDILPDGGISTGVGGTTAVRMVESRLSVQGYSTAIWIRIQESRHRIPSILARDFMRDFALFMEERTGRVLFLDQTDIARYGLTALGSP
jgi:predicted aspartyl protease